MCVSHFSTPSLTACLVLTRLIGMLSHPQVISFTSATVAAFIAVVGILSILAQVLRNSFAGDSCQIKQSLPPCLGFY